MSDALFIPLTIVTEAHDSHRFF